MTGDWDRSDSKRVSSRGSNNKHGDLLDQYDNENLDSWNPGASNPGASRFPNPDSGRPRLEIWVGKSLVKFGSMDVYGSNGAGFPRYVWVVDQGGAIASVAPTKAKRDKKSKYARCGTSQLGKADGRRVPRQSCLLQHHGVWKRESGLDRSTEIIFSQDRPNRSNYTSERSERVARRMKGLSQFGTCARGMNEDLGPRQAVRYIN